MDKRIMNKKCAAGVVPAADPLPPVPAQQMGGPGRYSPDYGHLGPGLRSRDIRIQVETETYPGSVSGTDRRHVRTNKCNQ